MKVYSSVKRIMVIMFAFVLLCIISLPVSAAGKKQTISFQNITKRVDSSASYVKARVTTGNKTGKITYTISDPSVASLTSNGLLKPLRVGTAKITATAPGNTVYAKTSKTITVTVNPAPTAITSLVSTGYDQFTVRWRSISGIDSYQIRYSMNSNYAQAKTASMKAGKNSYTRKDVQGGKTYYVSVRTCKRVENKAYYSNWSGTKKITIKKVSQTTLSHAKRMFAKYLYTYGSGAPYFKVMDMTGDGFPELLCTDSYGVAGINVLLYCPHNDGEETGIGNLYLKELGAYNIDVNQVLSSTKMKQIMFKGRYGYLAHDFSGKYLYQAYYDRPGKAHYGVNTFKEITWDECMRIYNNFLTNSDIKIGLSDVNIPNTEYYRLRELGYSKG